MSYQQHNHGGQLHSASHKYHIPLDDWLDLSTGISPTVYPLPEIPKRCWQRLPETNDGLEIAADNYYGSAYLLPVSGSQEAIQGLPKLFKTPLKVGIIKPAYHSHQQGWENAGHQIITLNSAEVDSAINTLDVLIVVNPTNPSTESFSIKILRQWHQQLSAHNGLLIVDEAFIDSTPKNSLIKKSPEKGLIVLRSIGKFFGLAGIRLGFIWAEEPILKQLAAQQNDWSVSHLARWAGKLALSDTQWQQSQRENLPKQSQKLVKLLCNQFDKNTKKYKNWGGCIIKNTHLFCYFEHPEAPQIQQQLAEQGILVRLFNDPSALRFGLPANETEFDRLKAALENIKP